MGSISYLTSAGNTTTQSVYTFSSQSLGTAATDRHIIVGVSCRKAGTSGTVSSITVGGESATIISQIQNGVGSNNSTVALAIALVSSGTTGDIVVTLSESFLRCGIGLWRADGIASATPHDSGTSTASAPATNLDLPPAGGFMIGMSKIAAAGTCTWSGIDEDFDSNYQSFTSHSGASKEFATSQTNLAVTATWTNTSAATGVFGSWAYSSATEINNERAAAITGKAAWLDEDWDYRVKITVLASKVNENLTNYPVYVDLSDFSAGFHTNVNQTDGRDIRVTKADGTTELAREVVFYDTTTDTGELHFKADSLSSTVDTDFYIYYGNTAATEPTVGSTYGRNAVWSDYKAVYHMQQDPSGTVIDSTGNRDFNANVGLTSGDLVTGKISKGISKAANEYWRNATGIPFSSSNDVSFQVWLYPTTWSATNPGLWRAGNTSTGTEAFNIFNSTTGRPWVRWATTDILKPTTGYQVSLNAWTLLHYVITSNAAVKFYAAGGIQHQETHDKSTATFSIHNLGFQFTTAEGVLGTYDEVRFRASELAAEWISTEFNNQNDPSTFYEIHAQETILIGNNINNEREASIIGIETISNERSSKLTGKHTLSTDLIDVEFSSLEEQINSERPATITGKNQTSANRAAKLTGKDTNNSQREATITGKQTAQNTRTAKLTGKSTSNAQRAAKLQGKQAANQEREARITGKQTTTAQTTAKLTGKDSLYSQKQAKIHGKWQSTSQSEASIIGQSTASRETQAKLTGKQEEQTNRVATLDGQETMASTRQALITGQQNTSQEKEAKLTGKQQTTQQRAAILQGKQSVVSTIQAKIRGSLSSLYQIWAKITGKETTAREVQATLAGIAQTFSQIQTKIRGKLTDQEQRQATLHGKAHATNQRRAGLIGKVNRRKPIILPSGKGITTISSKSNQTDLGNKTPQTVIASKSNQTTIETKAPTTL